MDTILFNTDGESPDGGVSRAGASRYRIRAILGKGGMATVYEGYDILLNCTVALKVLHEDMAQNGEMRSRFFQEAFILAQMDHPGVVPVFDVGDLAGYGPFYTMKKVHGETFRITLSNIDRISCSRSDKTTRVIGIFETICQTMAYAHAHGIMHRDLKPENIMVDDYGVVLVLDWGLSKKVNDVPQELGLLATQAGTVKGTPSYMSPEQASGVSHAVDFRSDVFALGIILYEILTGQLPFSGSTRTEVFEEIVQRDPPHPQKIQHCCSPVLADICMKALSKDPEERYATAKELSEDIRRHRLLLPTIAHKPRVQELIGNWIRRHGRLTTALITALSLIVLFTALMYHVHRTSEIKNSMTLAAEVQVQEMKRLQQQRSLDNATDAMTALANDVQAFDEVILDLEKQIGLASPEEEQALKTLGWALAEKKTVRAWYVDRIMILAGNTIATMMESPDQIPADLDPHVMAINRKLMLERVQSYIKIGEDLRAHNLVWDYIVRSRIIGWNEEETAELLSLKQFIENRLMATHGSGFTLPDWGKYKPLGLQSLSE
jgi:serine/threonine protein kinase